jgi:hypothetical protein
VPQRRGDKSAFPARAGSTLETAGELEKDRRDLASTPEAAPLRRNAHGQYFEMTTDPGLRQAPRILSGELGFRPGSDAFHRVPLVPFA